MRSVGISVKMERFFFSENFAMFEKKNFFIDADRLDLMSKTFLLS